jgi:hypothetical protein
MAQLGDDQHALVSAKEPSMKRGTSLSAAVTISLAALAGLAGPGASWGAEPAAPAAQKEAGTDTAAEAAAAPKPVEPKPLSENVKKGLAWLVKSQNSDGGWNQGEMSADKGREGEQIDKSNVADTCVAALALIRAGSTPAKGDHAPNLRKALEFICGHVERASQDGLLITDIKGTRVQTKLGSTVDTFAAALLLAECRNAMPDEPSRKRVVAALDKVMDKIEKNQKQDGRWVDANDGWAGALCQSLGHKALNRAAQQGSAVSQPALANAEKFALRNFDAKSGKVAVGGSANVELYARASNLQSFQDSYNTNKAQEPEIQRRRDVATTQAAVAKQAATQARAAGDVARAKQAEVEVANATAEVEAIDGRLMEVRGNAMALAQAQKAVVDRLDDKQFVAGFGSNGGEEFLSYMNIGESLAIKGGEAFAKWDKGMTENLNRVQNDDGSWTGHHCITGRTFCTATALLTLTVDRSVASVPVAAKVSGEASAR